MNILVINGPNINMLGLREPEIYGPRTYGDLCTFLHQCAESAGVTLDIRQSNHEGDLIDWIQQAGDSFDGILINPAAYTHTSIAILDALKAISPIPAVEVHLTQPSMREEFRRISYAGMACIKTFSGQGFDSYRLALEFIVQHLNP